MDTDQQDECATEHLRVFLPYQFDTPCYDNYTSNGQSSAYILGSNGMRVMLPTRLKCWSLIMHMSTILCWGQLEKGQLVSAMKAFA